MVTFNQPFGEVSCEDEMSLLQEDFKKYYFDHVPYNNFTLEKETYLIIGRRGSGKTSLSQYYAFHNQSSLKNSRSIDVDEPKVYQHVLNSISDIADKNSDLAIPIIVKVWEYVIW